jgi:hypothetical protein
MVEGINHEMVEYSRDPNGSISDELERRRIHVGVIGRGTTNDDHSDGFRHV